MTATRIGHLDPPLLVRTDLKRAPLARTVLTGRWRMPTNRRSREGIDATAGAINAAVLFRI